jgi:[acyl-carrier-protein] S-malonyltransferase
MTDISILFPGQGSQSIGMGNAWKNTPSWKIAQEAHEIIGIDFDELLTQENDLLQKTEFAQLAILVNSLIAYSEIIKTPKFEDSQVKYFAGHSLGQITALIAAGTFSFEEGLKFAKKRAEETQKCANENNGAMAAFIGGTTEDALNLCEQFSNLYVANDNCLGQIVLAGDASDVEKAVEIAKESGFKLAKQIPVDGAFHTPHMANASKALATYLESATLNHSEIPVISNDDAIPYTDSSIWIDKLPLHVESPVLWTQTMDLLSSTNQLNYEIGSGKILFGLSKRHKPEIKVTPITQLEDLES